MLLKFTDLYKEIVFKYILNILFCLQEYPDYKYKPRKKLKPHERGHKPRGRRPANPDAPKKPRATRTPAPKRRGKAKLLLASLGKEGLLWPSLDNHQLNQVFITVDIR